MIKSTSKPGAKKAPQVRVAKTVVNKHLRNRISGVLGYLILTAVVIYLCFAATIVRVVPNLSGPMVVKNMTFPGGVVPKGGLVAVNVNAPQGDDFAARLVQGLIPVSDAAVVRVHAGPYGKINWAEGLTTVDGAPIGVEIKKPEKEYLEDEYVVECVRGDCEPGSGFIIPVDHIYGEPIGGN